MKARFSSSEARTLLLLAAPVLLAQLCQSSMGFVDTVIAGRAGAVDMAGVALATSFWMPSILFGQGLLMAVTPLVAQAVGGGRKREIGHLLRQGLWLALLIGICLMLVLYNLAEFVGRMSDIDPALAAMSRRYLRAVLWGAPGMMFYVAFRTILDGQGKTRPAMLAGFFGAMLNVPLNLVLVFGWLGMPAMGGVGCGVATACVCWLMALIMLLSLRVENPGALKLEPPDRHTLLRIFRIGLPAAFAMLVEVSSFSIIAILIAPLGVAVVAGHQAALNISSLAFCVPLSLAVATTIRVGISLGEGNLPRARLIRRTALLVALGLAAFMAVCLFVLRYPIARIFTDNGEVVALAALLLIYDALYQISDAAQVVTLGALRGYNDTKAVFTVTFVSYWLIAMPLGYVTGLTSLLISPLGVIGFWISLIAGLSCAACLYLLRVNHLEKLPLTVIQRKISR